MNFVLYEFCLCHSFQKIFEAKPMKHECTNYDSNLIVNLTCGYKPLDWKKAKYNIDAYIKEGVEINDLVVIAMSKH